MGTSRLPVVIIIFFCISSLEPSYQSQYIWNHSPDHVLRPLLGKIGFNCAWAVVYYTSHAWSSLPSLPLMLHPLPPPLLSYCLAPVNPLHHHCHHQSPSFILRFALTMPSLTSTATFLYSAKYSTTQDLIMWRDLRIIIARVTVLLLLFNWSNLIIFRPSDPLRCCHPSCFLFLASYSSSLTAVLNGVYVELNKVGVSMPVCFHLASYSSGLHLTNVQWMAKGLMVDFLWPFVEFLSWWHPSWAQIF